jgi:hypothetical protein
MYAKFAGTAGVSSGRGRPEALPCWRRRLRPGEGYWVVRYVAIAVMSAALILLANPGMPPDPFLMRLSIRANWEAETLPTPFLWHDAQYWVKRALPSAAAAVVAVEPAVVVVAWVVAVEPAVLAVAFAVVAGAAVVGVPDPHPTASTVATRAIAARPTMISLSGGLFTGVSLRPDPAGPERAIPS